MILTRFSRKKIMLTAAHSVRLAPKTSAYAKAPATIVKLMHIPDFSDGRQISETAVIASAAAINAINSGDRKNTLSIIPLRYPQQTNRRSAVPFSTARRGRSGDNRNHKNIVRRKCNRISPKSQSSHRARASACRDKSSKFAAFSKICADSAE